MKKTRATPSFPCKAVILAAGFGTRMLPLSLDTPKPMMPLWGKPILGHILDMLARWGVAEVLINLHHQPGAICAYVRRRTADRPRITLSFEPDILGTGGALRHAAWFLDAHPFWMINADIAIDLDPWKLIKAFHHPKVLATLWMEATRGPRTVQIVGKQITNFTSSRPGTAGTYTFCGLQLLSPRILKFIPRHSFATIVQAYQQAIANSWKINGVCVAHSYWADIGTPENYIQTHREILANHRAGAPGANLLAPDQLRSMRSWQRQVQVKGFISTGQQVTIDQGARIADAIIWDKAHVARDAIVEQAIIGKGCQVHGRVPRMAVRSAFSLATPNNTTDIPLAMALQRLHWHPEETTVIPFEPRGSARHFTRLECNGQQVIMVRYSLEREENALYTHHAQFLKSIGLPVPEIIFDAPEKNFFVMQDLGDQSLQYLANRWRPARLTAFYQVTLAAVARWHIKGTSAARAQRLHLVAPFSPDLYRWERDFFCRHFLYPRLKPTPATARTILRELAAIARDLLKAPCVLIHRDLQASNILRVGRCPFFIDFQGMRFGSAAYDLASLLCDPYIELPLAITQNLLDTYNCLVNRRQKVPEELFWRAAVERLAQALGAYGRLSAYPETAWFGKYFAPGLRMMQRALVQSGACPHLLGLISDTGMNDGKSHHKNR